MKKFHMLSTATIIAIALLSSTKAMEETPDGIEPSGCWPKFSSGFKVLWPFAKVTKDVAFNIADEFVDGEDQKILDAVKENTNHVTNAVDTATGNKKKKNRKNKRKGRKKRRH